MDAQRKKGILDVCVLAVLKKGPSYGYKIIRDISRCIDISESTLYPILKRLEQNGSLKTYRREYNGRIRKYYELTETGQNRINVFLDEWEELRTMYLFIEEENRQEPERPFCGENTGERRNEAEKTEEPEPENGKDLETKQEEMNGTDGETASELGTEERKSEAEKAEEPEPENGKDLETKQEEMSGTDDEMNSEDKTEADRNTACGEEQK